MALTPDDVVTKQFQHVRFKEGFDPDEVDDFLDEIVVEWRKALEENEELKAKLAAYESGEQPAPAETAAVQEAPAEAAKEEEAPAEAAPIAPAVAAEGGAGGIIELAQRLHDEHVAEGKTKGDQLVAEAEERASQIVAEAENKQRELTDKLERERKTLEGRITELRQFERDYRAELRTYFENKLKDLETPATSSGETPVSAIGL